MVSGIKNSFSQQNRLSPLPGLVRVYHSVSDDEALQRIRKHGLMNARELFRCGLTDRDPSKIFELLNDGHDIISFQFLPEAPLPEAPCVGFDVDPNTTYVYNRAYRWDNNLVKYNASKISLADYIMLKKQAAELSRKATQGQRVIFDPYTAKPFYVSTKDKRYYDPDESSDWQLYITDPMLKPDTARHYLYLNEIIVPTPCIPPNQLIFAENDLRRTEKLPVDKKFLDAIINSNNHIKIFSSIAMTACLIKVVQVILQNRQYNL